MNFVEKTAIFGDFHNLVGIVSIPDTPKDLSPAVIILNSGIVHRVGPNRLSVTLARKLATKGIITLRFDISGIGDSMICSGHMPEIERAIKDTRDSMSYMTDVYNFSNFVLIGNCSGADIAHKVAVNDLRVIGAVFLDGYRYPTWKYYYRRFVPMMVNPIRLSKAIWRRIRKAIYRRISIKMYLKEDIERDIFAFGWNLPGKESVKKDLQVLVDRKVYLFYIFSRTVLECFNINDFKRMFNRIKFGDYLEVKRFDKACHTYIVPEYRNSLVECVSDWLDKNFS